MFRGYDLTPEQQQEMIEAWRKFVEDKLRSDIYQTAQLAVEDGHAQWVFSPDSEPICPECHQAKHD